MSDGIFHTQKELYLGNLRNTTNDVSQTCAILFQKFVSKTQMIGLFEWKLCCFEYYVVDLGI